MDAGNIKGPDNWQIAIMLAGVAIAIAALAAGNKPAFLIGLGLTVGGWGVMRNHPIQEQLLVDGLGRPRGKITGHPRNPSPLGVTMEIIGALLFLGGLVWFVLT